MPEKMTIRMTPRAFTRREKTIIRQDVKRFEKIGRDHNCVELEDYANFVADRFKKDDQGLMTPKTFQLFRGLVAYFGEQLLYETTLARLTGEVEFEGQGFLDSVDATVPGWLLVDRFSSLDVFVAPLIYDRIAENQRLPVPLDVLMDQIIDWNHGYLFNDEVETSWISGENVEPEGRLAA